MPGWSATVILEGGPLDGTRVRMPDRRARITTEADQAATDAGFRVTYRPTRGKRGETYVHAFDGWTRVIAEIPLGGPQT